MAETLHHVSVVLLLVSLVLFLYNTDRAVAISTLTLVVPYLVAQLKQTDLAYSVWRRLYQTVSIVRRAGVKGWDRYT